jgi:conjugal transfer ATP-binding protein TraC
MYAFNKISKKIADLFGEKDQLKNKEIGLKSPKIHREDMLWYEFPYGSYDPATGLFYNHYSQGFILEARPLTGANEETIKLLLSLLIDVLPKNYIAQFYLWGPNKVGDVFDQFIYNRTKRSGIHSWLANKRIEYLKKGVQKTLVSTDDYLLRDIRLFINVMVPVAGRNDRENELIKIRKNMITSLKSIDIFSASLPIDEFLSVVTDIIHPNSSLYSTRKNWDRHESLDLQLISPETKTTVFDDHILSSSNGESWEIRSLTVMDTPKSMTQWGMTHSIGHLFNTSLQMPCQFVLSLTVKIVDGSKSKAQWSQMGMGKKANSKMTEWISTLGSQYADWSHVRERLDENDQLASVSFQITLFSKAGHGTEHETKVCDLYRANGWQIANSRCMQFPHYLALLPMKMGEGLIDDFKHLGLMRTILASNAVNIAPLQGEWKGTERGILLLPGRRGQVAMWNPFDNKEGNYNVSVAAASGKGKSALMQDYVVGLHGFGGRVWIIDVGRSYENTCHQVGGTFIEFSRENSICINPFTSIKDFNASLALLKPLHAAMARPTTKTSDEENAHLEKAIKAAWDEKGNDATITTVADWLKAQSDASCQNLSHLLYPFTKDGMYGHYFEGKSSIDINQDFVVLELQELKSRPELQRIVLLTLMYQISEAMYWSDRKQYKSCIIDEAWDLLGSDQEGAAKFIEVGYRTARKYNGNFVTIVQSINDYFKSPASIAAFENSDYRIILKQTDEAIDQLKKSERLTMDTFTEHLLKSLRKTDEYSECVIKSPSGMTVHRIIFDHYSRILYSSKGEEHEAVKQLEKSGLSLKEAIERVAEKFTC